MRIRARPIFVRVVLWSALLVGLVGCASESSNGTGSTVQGSVTTVPSSSTTTGSPSNDTSTTTAATTTSTLPTTTTTTIPWDLSDQYVDQVEALMSTVESLRGRPFLVRPWVGTVFVEDQFDDMAHREALYELLGMLASGTNLQNLTDLQNLYGALRDPYVRPIFSRSGHVLVPDRFLPLDEYGRLLLVGVLTKALAHQHHPDSFHPEVDVATNGGDRTLARLALYEGEAVLVQTLYLESLGEDRMALLYEQASAAEAPASEQYLSSLDDIPQPLVEEVLFPGREGANLAFGLYRRGGFTALDQALDRPPETTEQVLHLEKYRAQEPAILPNPFKVVLEGYETVEESTWGELRWRGLFSHHGDPVSAARAAEGWGGDRYQMLWAPDSRKLVFAARLTADSFQDESEYNAAIRNLVREGMDVGDSRVIDTTTEWVGADYAMLSWDLGVLTLVVASDTEAGQQAAAQLGINLQ